MNKYFQVHPSNMYNKVFVCFQGQFPAQEPLNLCSFHKNLQLTLLKHHCMLVSDHHH